MAKSLSLVPAILLISLCANAQITVDQNDFASAGTSVFLSNGQINPFLNITTTGPNSNWNFSTLRSTGQQQIDYLDVSGTNFIYALFYANVFFNPNRANIALDGTDIPFSQALGVTNPFTFYYKNSSMYRKVGYGGEIAGIPISIPMNTFDTIYRFPMNFGDTHNTNSDYSTGLPGVLTSFYTQNRITNIDGWGSLTTPYGTYDVLRSKSEVFGSDSVYVDSLAFGVNIPRSKVTEYKWIAKNEEVPLLQINTSTIFGVEIINLILFKDRELSIVVDSTAGILCPGSPMNVFYTAAGTFNPAAFLQQGNRFTVQLSNNTGSFATPVNIGNITATTSGTVSTTIPNNVTGGTGYRIRIISNSPVDTSVAFGPFTINFPPTASITAKSATTICIGNSVELVANSGSGYLYQWQANGVDISGATAQNYIAPGAGSYTVAITNVCATATSQPLDVTESPEPVHSVTASALATCDGSPVTISASNISGVSPVTYQWYENGDTIPGATDLAFIVTSTGTYSMVVTNSDGCTFTTDSSAIVIDSVDIPALYADGSTYFCPGGNVTLRTDSSAGLNYQWLLNGVNIQGANAYAYTASVGGSYTLMVSDSCDSEISTAQTVVVTPRPVHTVTPSSALSCDGSPIVITASNTSGASPTWYQWYADTNAIAGATDTILTITDPGNYWLRVIDGTGCIFNSATISVTFDDSVATPLIYESGSTSFCTGESVELSTDTNSRYSYQWKKDGVIIPGANDYIYIATQGGNYTVVVTSASGCSAASGIKKVNVYPLPSEPDITQHGDTLSTDAAASYQWNLNGTLIPGATSQSYQPDTTGYYTVVITDGSGCTNTSQPFYYLGTGVHEAGIAGWHLTVSPNPVAGSAFFIKSSVLFSEVQVFNTAGSLVYQSNFFTPAHELSIDGTGLQRGVYFIKVRTGKEARVVKMVKI